jgi:transcription termination/antitermination protein NusA
VKRVKLDMSLMGIHPVIERITRARVKDVILREETYYIIVQNGQLWKALGKSCANIEPLKRKLGKNVRIFEFDSDPCKFLRNLVHPLKLESVEVKGNDIIVKDSNRQTKSLLIGRGGKNLSYYKEVVSRYFPHEIKVE